MVPAIRCVGSPAQNAPTISPEPMWKRNISLPDDREGRPYGLERNCGENHRSAVGEAHEPPAQEVSVILP